MKDLAVNGGSEKKKTIGLGATLRSMARLPAEYDRVVTLQAGVSGAEEEGGRGLRLMRSIGRRLRVGSGERWDHFGVLIRISGLVLARYMDQMEGAEMCTRP